MEQREPEGGDRATTSSITASLLPRYASVSVAHTAFSVQLAMTGLLPNGFTPVQQTTYAASPSVEMLP